MLALPRFSSGFVLIRFITIVLSNDTRLNIHTNMTSSQFGEYWRQTCDWDAESHALNFTLHISHGLFDIPRNRTKKYLNFYTIMSSKNVYVILIFTRVLSGDFSGNRMSWLLYKWAWENGMLNVFHQHYHYSSC